MGEGAKAGKPGKTIAAITAFHATRAGVVDMNTCCQWRSKSLQVIEG
jgi:hypothetical protein